MPSSTSFFYTIIGLCYYSKYLDNNIVKDFGIAILFVTIAALCRTPFNIYLFSILLHQIFNSELFKRNTKIKFAILSFSYAVIISWQIYKHYLNKTYGTQFLTTITPANDISEFLENTLEVFNKWKWQLFSPFHYIIIAILIFTKKTNKNKLSLLNYCYISLLLFLVYFIVMNRQFIHHEYYFLDSFYIPMVFIIIYLIDVYIIKHQITNVLLFIALVACTVSSIIIQNIKYSDHIWDTAEISRKGYENSYKFLDSLKIPTNAKILVIDAFASNAPLMQLHRKGYTLIDRTTESIDSSLKKDYDYIVVLKIFLPSEIITRFPNFLSKVDKIGSTENLLLFKKRNNQNIESKDSLTSILDFKNPSYYCIDSINAKDWTKLQLENNGENGVILPIDLYGPTLIIRNKSNLKKLFFEIENYFEEKEDDIVICVTLHKKISKFFILIITLNQKN